ncbi:hypothetical protein [Candidatus Leptofilum sp.]|uniref:hypothetical protein n=1 Tax=Candidatus Leptofilum sp. TaxID=3241576 RepID=UPI003B598E8B
MLNLPPYPDVFTTRHITCVSCKEKFTVTEGHRGRRADFRDGDSLWGVHANSANSVNLQYQGARQQRPVVPLPKQRPQTTQPPINNPRPFAFQPVPVNCPRCGADNRNWLTLKQQTGDKSFWSFFRLWRYQFPSAFTAVFIAILFALLALALPDLLEISQTEANVLAISTIVVTVLLINNIISQWDAYREDLHIAKVLPNSRRLETVLWGRYTLFLLIASVILPILIFVAGPVAIQTIVEILETTPEETVEITAEGMNTDFDEQVNQSVEQVNAFGVELQDALGDLPTDDNERLEREIEELSQDIEDTAVTAAEDISVFGIEGMERLENNVDDQIAALESTRKSESLRFTEEVMGSVRYLAMWGLIMGFSLLFALMIMMPAMKTFAVAVNANLPPPVFYSVANMTRLVTWEARQALEISGDHFFRIQWMSVNRNEEGGLNLVGLFREPPQIDVFGQPMGTKVRAQKHTIHTDMWCRVTTVKIEDVEVPITVADPIEPTRTPRITATSPTAPPLAPVPANPAPLVVGQQQL